MSTEVFRIELASKIGPDKVDAAVGAISAGLAAGGNSVELLRIDTFAKGTYVYVNATKPAADALRAALTRKGSTSRTTKSSGEQLASFDDLAKALAKAARPVRKPPVAKV
jgi:hypothetical protein